MLLIMAVLLAIVGLAISIYFLAITYGWVRADAAWVPKFCRMGEATCASIVFTPQARLFGPPNSALGVVWYVALLFGLSTGSVAAEPWRWLYLGGAVLTVLAGAYLTYSLLFVTRVPCRLCFTSHAINLVLLLALLAL